jgi:hypothetical protein
MNQLDEFEKYLREQLKGHIEPEPLMWRRLNDALGRLEPWYARSAFKYGLTAICAMVFGSISTYLYLKEQQQFKGSTSVALNEKKTFALSSKKAADLENIAAKKLSKSSETANFVLPLSKSDSPSDILIHSRTNFPAASNALTSDQKTSNNDFKRSELFIDTKAMAVNAEYNKIEDALRVLPLSKLKTSNLSLQITKPISPEPKRLSLSIATGHIQSNLPAFSYQLGPHGTHQANQRQTQNLLLQLHYFIYKNWALNIGVQQLQTELDEHFYQSDIYSFDEKEHFLFPYVYGFRQISDEELHGGPWPLGPNPPGGPENIHVKANYTSKIEQRQLFIPITISFQKQYGPFEAQLHAGLALRYNYRTLQTLSIPGYLPSTILLTEQNRRIQTFAQSQLRFSYLANRHLSIFIEPQIRSTFQLQNEIHTTSYRTNSKALYAGICWKF